MFSIGIQTATPADLAGIADLINSHSLKTVGTRRALIDANGDLRASRYIPPSADQFIMRSMNGQIIGHAYLLSRQPHVVVEMGFTIHPDFQTSELNSTLFNHLEARSHEAIHLAPEGARVVIQATVLADDNHARQLLRDRGFAEARQWVHFELALTAAPTVSLPEGITIREMDPRHDWPSVGAVMDAAFSDHWGEMGPEVRTLVEEDEEDEEEGKDADVGEEIDDDPYSNSHGLCFVAEVKGEVVGSCLCNARTVEWPDAGKLGSLSVLRAYRRRGVGQALTAAALAEFYRRGTRRVITDTDNASFTGANRLYPRFGFRPYRYEWVYEKQIRSGKEWRVLSPDDL